MGIQGFTGDLGDQGPEGIRGPLGIQGDQGIKGLPGELGQKGEPGTLGFQGQIGQKGPKGEFDHIIRQNLLPDKANAYSLGTKELPFKDLYISVNTLFVGEAKISSGINIETGLSRIELPGSSTIGGIVPGTLVIKGRFNSLKYLPRSTDYDTPEYSYVLSIPTSVEYSPKIGDSYILYGYLWTAIKDNPKPLPESYEADKLYFAVIHNEDWENVGKLQGIQGEKGNIGEIGLTGNKGDQGDQGIKGDIGNEGPKGIKGFIGDKGSRGFEGIQGLRGYTGPIGLKGIQGIQGIKGIQGLDGSVGDIGPIGPQGIQGIHGIQGEKGEIGITGPIGIKGEQGDQGIKGEIGIGLYGDTGPQGIKGNKGNYGDKGEIGIGIKGDQGNIGIQGIKGNKGEIGEKGVIGQKGLSGPIGLKGLKGIIGSKGDIGEKGIIGIKGNQGFYGQKGEIGESGKTIIGPKGIKGDFGPQGPKGLRGPKGTDAKLDGNFYFGKISDFTPQIISNQLFYINFIVDLQFGKTCITDKDDIGNHLYFIIDGRYLIILRLVLILDPNTKKILMCFNKDMTFYEKNEINLNILIKNTNGSFQNLYQQLITIGGFEEQMYINIPLLLNIQEGIKFYITLEKQQNTATNILINNLTVIEIFRIGDHYLY